MSYAPYVETYDSFSRLLTDSHASVLDVACGPGNFSRYLLDRYPDLQITGVDLAPAMIKLAGQNVPEGVFNVLDSRDIGTLDTTFDIILLGFCLPYLSRNDAAQLLVKTSQMMNPGGLLYLSTMEGDYERSGYQSNDSDDRVYVFFHQLEFLSEQLESNGFDIIHTEKIPFPSDDGSTVDDLFIFARANR